MNDKLFDELIEGSIEMVGIEQLTRIASALERIAEALEKQNETNIMHVDDELISLRECGVLRRAGIDYCMMGDDKTAETCRSKFDGMPNFGKSPDTQSTHINIKCRNANEFREQYMQQPKVDDSE